MNISDIEQLYDIYKVQRQSILNMDQFVMLAKVFPTLLVINSDGVIDKREQVYLSKLAEMLANMSELQGLNELSHSAHVSTFRSEIDYLLNNQEKWKDAFLDSLDNYLVDEPDDRDNILDMIQMFVETSDNDAIEETEMLMYIKGKLKLA